MTEKKSAKLRGQRTKDRIFQRIPHFLCRAQKLEPVTTGAGARIRETAIPTSFHASLRTGGARSMGRRSQRLVFGRARPEGGRKPAWQRRLRPNFRPSRAGRSTILSAGDSPDRIALIDGIETGVELTAIHSDGADHIVDEAFAFGAAKASVSYEMRGIFDGRPIILLGRLSRPLPASKARCSTTCAMSSHNLSFQAISRASGSTRFG